MCDDDGRTEDEPDVIASVLFQVMRDVTPDDVDGWLDEMARVGLILRYSDTDGKYLSVVKWHEVQHPRRPQSSRLPAPPSGPVGTGPNPSRHVGTRRDDDGPIPQEGLGEEMSGVEMEGESEGEVEPAVPVDNRASRKALALAEQAARREGVAPVIQLHQGEAS
jgi:hypothetical protein